MSKDPSESENIGNKWQQFAEQHEREDQTDHVVEDAVEEIWLFARGLVTYWEYR